MLDNPFTPNDPATPDVFGGRVNELDELCQILVETGDGKTRKRRILGERGIGKTSVLNYLESYARGTRKYESRAFNFLVVRVSLASTTTAMDLLSTVDHEVRAEIDRFRAARRIARMAWDFVSQWSILSVEFKGKDEKKKQILIKARKELAGLIKGFAKSISTSKAVAIKDGKAYDGPDGVVIILDECDLAAEELRLGELLKSFTEDLGTKARTFVVLTGLYALDEVMHKSHLSSFRAFRKIELDRLNRSDIGDVISRCLESQHNSPPVTILPDARELLISLSEGFPHFAQEFGFCSFSEISDHQITAECITNGASKPKGAIDRIGEAYHFNTTYDALSSSELEVVLAFGPIALTKPWVSADAADSVVPAEKERIKAVKSLVRKGTLISDGKPRPKYKFRHNTFAYWVKLRETRSQSTWDPVVDLFQEQQTTQISNFDELREELGKYGLDEQWLTDLEQSIKNDGQVEGIGPSVTAWLAGLLTAAAVDDLDLDRNDAVFEIPSLLRSYLGN